MSPGQSLQFMLLLACMLGAGCGANTPTAHSTQPADQRIVSLAPNLTDTILRLGLGDRLVGVSTYCLAPNDEAVRVGGYLDPDIETILSLNPDLVVTAPNPSLEQALTTFEVPFHVMQSQWSTVSDTRTSILEVALLLDAEDQGAALVTELDEQLANVQEAARGLATKSVLLVIERQPGSMIAVGPGSHIEELIALAGGRSVVTGTKPYPNVDIETVVQWAPEVIIDVSIGDTEVTEEITEQARTVWGAYPTLPAAQTGAVYVERPGLLVQPGPGIGESAGRLFTMIHGNGVAP